jgi:ABC-2 type transport system permease protein
MFSLLRYELKSRWKSILGWGVGLSLFGALYIFIFPEVEEEMMSLSDLSIYQVMGMSLGSFEDFIASIVLLFLPLILGVYAIVTTTNTLAGEEDAGTLELLMAKPIRRWEIVMAKTAAIAISIAGILVLAGFGCAGVLALIKPSVDTAVEPLAMVGAIVASWPLIMVFASIALFLGATLPNRRLATMTTVVLFIASYFAENLAGMVSSLDALRPFLLFSYHDGSASILTEGVKLLDILVLVVVMKVFSWLALFAFGRRNITVGAWPWTRNAQPDGVPAK